MAAKGLVAVFGIAQEHHAGLAGTEMLLVLIQELMVLPELLSPVSTSVVGQWLVAVDGLMIVTDVSQGNAVQKVAIVMATDLIQKLVALTPDLVRVVTKLVTSPSLGVVIPRPAAVNGLALVALVAFAALIALMLVVEWAEANSGSRVENDQELDLAQELVVWLWWYLSGVLP